MTGILQCLCINKKGLKTNKISYIVPMVWYYSMSFFLFISACFATFCNLPFYVFCSIPSYKHSAVLCNILHSCCTFDCTSAANKHGFQNQCRSAFWHFHYLPWHLYYLPYKEQQMGFCFIVWNHVLLIQNNGTDSYVIAEYVIVTNINIVVFSTEARCIATLTGT